VTDVGVCGAASTPSNATRRSRASPTVCLEATRCTRSAALLIARGVRGRKVASEGASNKKRASGRCEYIWPATDYSFDKDLSRRGFGLTMTCSDGNGKRTEDEECRFKFESGIKDVETGRLPRGFYMMRMARWARQL